MDPMRDILALFGNVASTDNLTIEFKYRFKERKNLFGYIRDFAKWAW
jgi:hypothetical protein